MKNETIVAVGDEQTRAVQLLVLRSGLKLEIKGLRGRFNCFTIIKQKFGLKGTKVSVLEQYENILREKGIIQ